MQGHPEVSNVAEKPRQNGERRFTTRLLTSAAWAIPFVSVCVFSYKPHCRPTIAVLPRLSSTLEVRLPSPTSATTVCPPTKIQLIMGFFTFGN